MAAREQGFTLIELLVALSVFAIAALALLRLDGYAVATTADLDARAMAEVVARNEIALAATDPGTVVRGSSQATVSNGGRQFLVRRTITPTADQRLVRVDVLVVEGQGAARAMLTTVKRVA